MKQSYSATSSLTQPGVLERPRYFPRQLMTPTELTLEQEYFRDKMRRHNRLLHGYGVICGAWVSPVPLKPETSQPQSTPAEMAKMKVKGAGTPVQQTYNFWLVKVSPGFLLSPEGDEIVIACDQVVDVRNFCEEVASDESCVPSLDPWHSDASVARPDGPAFVAVRYKEIRPGQCACSPPAVDAMTLPANIPSGKMGSRSACFRNARLRIRSNSRILKLQPCLATVWHGREFLGGVSAGRPGCKWYHCHR